MAWIGAIVSAVATLAGTAATYEGQQASQRAANNAVINQLNSQQQYEKQGQANFNSLLTQSSPNAANTALQAGAANRNQLYQNLNALPVSGAALTANPQSSLNTVRDNATRSQSDSSRAAVSGLSDWQLQQWLANQQSAQQLGVTNNLSQGQLGTLQPALNAAAQQGTGLQALGGLATAGGGLFGTYWGLNHPISGSNAASNQAFNGQLATRYGLG